MFDSPEYKSYIALCRELRLERNLKDGDCVDDGVRPDVQICGITVAPGVMQHGGIWLPRLDQWLAMLEEADPEYSRLIVIEHREDSFYACRYINDWAKGATREEAAARLWVAVTEQTS